MKSQNWSEKKCLPSKRRDGCLTGSPKNRKEGMGEEEKASASIRKGVAGEG